MISNESTRLSGTNHNSSFMTESKANESSSSNETSSEKATSFTTTSSLSSSSHRHSIQRQITTSSEVKVSCVQSNLSDIKSSLSELKDLDIGNPGFRKSIENILLQNDTNEPLVTYPESPTPSASGSSIATFPCSVSGSRKNSVSIIEDFPGGNYERRLSTTSKTKLLSEQFIEQQQIASSARQLSNAISEKSLDSKLVSCTHPFFWFDEISKKQSKRKIFLDEIPIHAFVCVVYVFAFCILYFIIDSVKDRVEVRN